MKLEQVRGNAEAMEEGEWKDHPYFDEIQIRVRSPYCDAVDKRRAHLLNRRTRRRLKAGDAIRESNRVESLCTAECLLDVKGLDDVTYSAEMGREWAEDPGMRRFMEGVREAAEEVGLEEQAAYEEDRRD